MDSALISFGQLTAQLGQSATGQELTLNNVYFGAVNFVPFGHRGLKLRLFENPSLFTLTTFTSENF